MIDINSINFERFLDMKEVNIGVVGHGYVGQAVEAFFAKVSPVTVYDKAKPELGTLKDVVEKSNVVFVCVPTPMNKDGSCHTGIVESVLDSLVAMASEVGRSLKDFVVVVKSTVPPGFTDGAKEKRPGLRLVFSPEFLTEKSSIDDFERTNRVILGGDLEDCRIVFKVFEGKDPGRVSNDELIVAQCFPKVAEMVKLFTNGILMTKVLFANEIYQICQKLGVNYDEVRVLAVLDGRIGASHTAVPGHDGKLGAGGSCFPKDINNLAYTAKLLGLDEKIFSAVIQRNEELRGKDWEELKGRAVVDDSPTE